MKHRWKKSLAAVGLLILGIVLGWLFPRPSLLAVERITSLSRMFGPLRVRQATETTMLFRRVCGELLSPTATGQHYLDLGYTYGDELTLLVWDDEVIEEQAWRLIDLYSPPMEALLDGRGNEVTVSQEMVDEMLRFLAEVESRAGPELRQIIAEERKEIPWEEMIGLTMEKAWARLQEAVPGDPSLAAIAPAWGVPQFIVEGRNARKVALATGHDGTLHAVWVQTVNGVTKVYYSHLVEGEWSEPLSISPEATDAWAPDLAVGDEGVVHVVWEEGIGGDIFYCRYSVDGWSSAVNVTRGTGGGEPVIALGNDGRVYVATSSHYFFYAGDGWSEPLTPPDGAWQLQVAADAAGTIHFAWAAPDKGGLAYARLVNGTDWTPTVYIAAPGIDQPRLAVAPDGRAHAVWIIPTAEGGRAVYYSTGLGESWTETVRLSRREPALWPSLAVDGQGHPHVAWHTSDVGAIFYTMHSGEEWSEPVSVSGLGTAALVRVAVGHGGRVYVGWHGATAGREGVHYVVGPVMHP